MSEPSRTRIPGHALRLYGNPHNDDGTPASIYTRTGRARCECGAMSDNFPDKSMRRLWHRNIHKPAVIAATTSEGGHQ